MSWKQRLPFLRWSMVRMAFAMPGFGKTGQIGDGREEATAAYVAAIARRIWAHAGLDDRITCVVGTIGDGGSTLESLAESGFTSGTLDLLFIDHDKSAYLADLQSILDRGWLHTGSIVVADNVRIPGAPKYRAYMREQQGKLFNTVEHATHVEYQTLLSDLVLESDYLAG
jgi:catechol O-methyltransferase